MASKDSDAPEASEQNPEESNRSGTTPPVEAVYRFLTYSLSLPERTIRSTAAVVSGALRESAALLVPSAFQNSRTYQIFVVQMLDFVAQDVGGVSPQSTSAGSPAVENYVARKTVGNFVELAGLATLHLSPMTLLAIISDVAYGSKTYLRELADELKKQGVVSGDTSINSISELLESVGEASGTTAGSLDLPPLTASEMVQSLRDTAAAIKKIDMTKMMPQAEIEKLWQSMREVAEQENVSVLNVATTMTMFGLNQAALLGKGALTSAQVAGLLVDRHILDHYRTGLTRIREKGMYVVLRDSSKPYIDAVWNNFSAERMTITEDVVTGRWFSRVFKKLCIWLRKKFRGKQKEEPSPKDEESVRNTDSDSEPWQQDKD